jgi:Xaa-Pro aminopeptidase
VTDLDVPQLPDLDDLAPLEVAARMRRYRIEFAAKFLDVQLVTELTNIRYLTGFSGSSAQLVVTLDGALLITDGRYETQAARQIEAAGADVEVAIGATQAAQAELVVGAVGDAERIGLEADHVTWSQQQAWAKCWSADRLVPTVGLAQRLRTVKDDGEVARISAACVIADAALARVRPMLDEQPTERELAIELDATMRRFGAEDVSFETIVASGPNGAMPHHRPSDRTIVEGDLVVIDFGALVEGYHSDMTRTFTVGEVTPERQRMFDVVAEAQQAGIDAVHAGVTAGAVDAVCRDIITEVGWGDAFAHSTGHGVGLDIHEDPRVASGGDATLDAGFVVTVEPGVYLPELGGVRIEDTVVVTDDGCRVLTGAPKDPTP